MNPDYLEALQMAVSIAEQGEPTEITIERAREFLSFMKGEVKVIGGGAGGGMQHGNTVFADGGGTWMK